MQVFRSYPTLTPDQMLRQAYTFQPNSEMLYQHYPPPTFIPGPLAFPSMVPPKVSCYNCGSQSHNGPECPDPTIEDVAKQGKLHFSDEQVGPIFLLKIMLCERTGWQLGTTKTVNKFILVNDILGNHAMCNGCSKNFLVSDFGSQ